MDYEIGHINLSVPMPKPARKNEDGDEEEEEQAIVGWHRDSYPFVCVLMMSDTTDMVGGETALRTGTGEIKKVRGPSKVSLPPLHALVTMCALPISYFYIGIYFDVICIRVAQ
jgi:hypothetical protein